MNVAVVPANPAALAEQVVIKGDLSKLSELERMSYYTAVCNSLGLNPLTRPFEYISLNGKLTLYATRAAGDQLRALRGITITNLDPRQIGDLFVVTATGRDRTGREDASTGAVTVVGLRGEALANAMMKAETKAKRRLTLSLAGLGWTDETEVESIPGAERVDVPQLTLAERAAAKAETARNADAARAESSGEPAAEPQAPRQPAAVQEAPAEPVAEREAAEAAPGEVVASAPIGRLAFMARIKEAGVTQDGAIGRASVLFPGVAPKDLSDEQRGLLLDDLMEGLTPAELAAL